ncbi:M23 family metallopeptidase [Streptomyces sp. NPDC006879]|uniref:M23 family metallopeptidase n=1 Tax=Streptomyces sp. NPDC006879 TaxID=3364767 RepID=UPI00368A145E
MTSTQAPRAARAATALAGALLLLTLTASGGPAEGWAAQTPAQASGAPGDRQSQRAEGAGRPLDGPLQMPRGWLPPATRYTAGHRGVDLSAPPGAEVRATARGRVHFAGPVAGRGVLSLIHADSGDPPLRTTYQPVHPLVATGDEVDAGQVVAVLSPSGGHCPAVSCLHWGLRRGAEYLNPLELLPRPVPRLLPYLGPPPA